MDRNNAPFGFWVSDSSGRNSYHINGSNLSFKQSFAGSLLHNMDGDWIALDKDGKELGAGSLYEARAIVETNARKSR